MLFNVRKLLMEMKMVMYLCYFGMKFKWMGDDNLLSRQRCRAVPLR